MDLPTAKPIYLDYAATTPVDPRVVQQMVPFLYEQFGNPADMAERHAFNLKLARSGREVAVSAGQSALEALEQAGVTLDNVCRQGVRGACRCKVLSGPIEHRDVCLSDEEHEGGKVMTVCVSRAGKDATLVLDI